MRIRYPLDQSPLYRLRSRVQLAKLLHIAPDELNTMARASDSLYECFPKMIEKDGKKKERYIERPKPRLRFVQKRLVNLLNRIVPPNYLHSAFRGRSYISNASQHPCNCRVAKIDIRKFFPSAYAGRVYRSFVDVFQCSHDVAGTLAKLTTAFGHLPTGGNSSSMISFFAFKPMFDEIHALAVTHGLVMTCCVDDMTFSGADATSNFLNKVRVIVHRYGLKVHKRHWFDSHQTKIVTGVALTPRGPRVPNGRRKKLHLAQAAFQVEANLHKKVKIGEEVLGRVTEAAQIEEKFVSLVSRAAQKLRDVKKALG
jgi:RNA-directed DNA polymerase